MSKMSMAITFKLKDETYDQIVALSEDRAQKVSETCRGIIEEYFSKLSEKLTEEEYHRIFG